MPRYKTLIANMNLNMDFRLIIQTARIKWANILIVSFTSQCMIPITKLSQLIPNSSGLVCVLLMDNGYEHRKGSL